MSSESSNDSEKMRNICALEAELIAQGECVKVDDVHVNEKSLSDYIQTSKLLSIAIMFTCNTKHLKKYKVDEADAECLGEAWGPVLDRFMPKIPDGPLTNALIVTSVVIASKIALAKKAEKEVTKEVTKEGVKTLEKSDAVVKVELNKTEKNNAGLFSSRVKNEK